MISIGSINIIFCYVKITKVAIAQALACVSNEKIKFSLKVRSLQIDIKSFLHKQFAKPKTYFSRDVQEENSSKESFNNTPFHSKVPNLSIALTFLIFACIFMG